MANYYVTGVWKNAQKEITHLFIHYINEDRSFNEGMKKTADEVIGLLRRSSFTTLVWNYQTPGWTIGEPIRPVVMRGTSKSYLRTFKDNTETNNLDNIINMSCFSF